LAVLRPFNGLALRVFASLVLPPVLDGRAISAPLVRRIQQAPARLETYPDSGGRRRKHFLSKKAADAFRVHVEGQLQSWRGRSAARWRRRASSSVDRNPSRMFAGADWASRIIPGCAAWLHKSPLPVRTMRLSGTVINSRPLPSRTPNSPKVRRRSSKLTARVVSRSWRGLQAMNGAVYRVLTEPQALKGDRARGRRHPAVYLLLATIVSSSAASGSDLSAQFF